MLKKLLLKIFLLIFIYCIFVILASDLAIKIDNKLGIKLNHKILEIKDKLVFAFSSEDNFKKSLQETANTIDNKTEKVTEKLKNPAPNLQKKLKKEENLGNSLK